MARRKIMAFPLPGAQTQPDDVRVVIQYVVDELRKQFFEGNERQCTPVHMSDSIGELGFSISERISLLGLLQRAGILTRISSQENRVYLWYITPIQDMMTIPLEVFEAAWRDFRHEEDLTNEVKRLKTRSSRSQTTPAPDEEFLARIDVITSQLTEQRDAALSKAAELEETVARLEAEIRERPDTSRKVIEQAFLARLEARVNDIKPPRTRRSRS